VSYRTTIQSINELKYAIIEIRARINKTTLMNLTIDYLRYASNSNITKIE
jgi:hypothetical protein